MGSRSKPRIWITYAWADDEEGDFSYLVQELDKVGVEVIYDRIALIPGRDLWEQIADQITNSPIDGWGYLITPNSLAREACREELAYALHRALKTRGRSFPLIGLLHRVRIDDVPPALLTRLCVSLANPTWKEEVKAGLEASPLRIPSVPQTRFIWRVHEAYQGDPTQVAVEVQPRFETVMYWRFAAPTSASVVRWGHGPSGGGAISGVQTHVVKGGSGEVEGVQVTWFGAGDALSSSVSAYVVFRDTLPDFVFFGLASEPFGDPGAGEVRQFR